MTTHLGSNRDERIGTRRRRTHRRLRSAVVAAVAATGIAGLAVSCTPPPSGGGGDGVRFVDQVFPTVTTTSDLTYATAPDLQTGQPVQLELDLYGPAGDTMAARPAIVWIHGGGFKGGKKDAVVDAATAYARRGYVTIGIDYRVDPGNRCQDVQHGLISDPVELATEAARCSAAIAAAQHDTQAAIRWLRANAATYGVDPGRIAAAGFSAGAVTATNVAERSEDPGTVGDHLDQPSGVDVGLAASGCNYLPDSIDASDAPVSLLASELDRAVLFSCTVETAERAAAVGTPVQTLFHYGEPTHGLDLYLKYRSETDAAWTSFLVEHLDLAGA